MGRTPAPPLAKFSRQVIDYALSLIAETGHDASGRWLAAQIEMSHNYVAKRLRYELPFTTTDVERIASAFGMSARAFVDAAADPVERAIAADRAGDWTGLALAAHAYDNETDEEFDDAESGDGV